MVLRAKRSNDFDTNKLWLWHWTCHQIPLPVVIILLMTTSQYNSNGTLFRCTRSKCFVKDQFRIFDSQYMTFFNIYHREILIGKRLVWTKSWQSASRMMSSFLRVHGLCLFLASWRVQTVQQYFTEWKSRFSSIESVNRSNFNLPATMFSFQCLDR